MLSGEAQNNPCLWESPLQPQISCVLLLIRNCIKENWAPAVSHPNSTPLRSCLHSHWPHPSFSQQQFHTPMWASHIPCSILFFHGTGNIFSWWPIGTCWNQLRPILILTFAPSAFGGKEKREKFNQSLIKRWSEDPSKQLRASLIYWLKHQSRNQEIISSSLIFSMKASWVTLNFCLSIYLTVLLSVVGCCWFGPVQANQ